jgi:hypothetical protein
MDKEADMTIPILLQRLRCGETAWNIYQVCNVPRLPLCSPRQRDSNLFALLYGWFLATISKQLEVTPGSEFRQAYEEARKLTPPARVLLVSMKICYWHSPISPGNLEWSCVFSSDLCDHGENRMAQWIHATCTQVDRPVNITIARAWAGLGRMEKLRLCWHLVRDIFNLREYSDKAVYPNVWI